MSSTARPAISGVFGAGIYGDTTIPDDHAAAVEQQLRRLDLWDTTPIADILGIRERTHNDYQD